MTSDSKAPLKERVTGAWRVYNAICQLGYGDCSTEQIEEIEKARKAAYDIYAKLSKQLERKP